MKQNISSVTDEPRDKFPRAITLISIIFVVAALFFVAASVLPYFGVSGQSEKPVPLWLPIIVLSMALIFAALVTAPPRARIVSVFAGGTIAVVASAFFISAAFLEGGGFGNSDKLLRAAQRTAAAANDNCDFDNPKIWPIAEMPEEVPLLFSAARSSYCYKVVADRLFTIKFLLQGGGTSIGRPQIVVYSPTGDSTEPWRVDYEARGDRTNGGIVDLVATREPGEYIFKFEIIEMSESEQPFTLTIERRSPLFHAAAKLQINVGDEQTDPIPLPSTKIRRENWIGLTGDLGDAEQCLAIEAVPDGQADPFLMLISTDTRDGRPISTVQYSDDSSDRGYGSFILYPLSNLPASSSSDGEFKMLLRVGNYKVADDPQEVRVINLRTILTPFDGDRCTSPAW